MVTLPNFNELKERVETAPKSIQEYISSEELMQSFVEIKNTHKLHLDEAGNLSIALNAVFLGVRPAAEFPELLKVALEQNSSAYDGVLRDVNEKIFVAFRRKMQQPEVTQPKTASPTPAPAPRMPTPPPPPAGSIKRIGDQVMKQAERVEVNTLAASTPVTPAATPPVPVSAPEPKKYPTVDPYRESIDEPAK